MLGSQRGGFTIIEVMLFLGLSSLLLAGIMAGVSAQVVEQRRQGPAIATMWGGCCSLVRRQMVP